MKEDNALINIIENLISKHKEGTYWDFKREWHKNKANLIRDILSLANAVDHKGERYLIFGIQDENFNIIDQKGQMGRRMQVELLDLFANIPFLGGYAPSLSIEIITIDKKEIDVIIIEDQPFKPFCLKKLFRDGKEYIYPGTVYSRIGDKNSAKDSSSDLYQIERMWRERFGLDKTPLERFQLYLLQCDEWVSDGISKAYHKQFPEFTIVEEYNPEKLTGTWWSAFIDKPTTYNMINFKYHSTLLKQLKTCYFEREEIRIPYPDVEYIKLDNNHPDADNTYSLYSFTQGSFDFSLLYYLYRSYMDEPEQLFLKKAISSPSKPPIKHLPFIVFKSVLDKENFIQRLENQMDSFFENHNLEKTLGSSENLIEREKLFAYWAYEKYHNEWLQEG